MWFLCLFGGFGTRDERFELFTLPQTGKHERGLPRFALPLEQRAVRSLASTPA